MQPVPAIMRWAIPRASVIQSGKKMNATILASSGYRPPVVWYHPATLGGYCSSNAKEDLPN